MTAVLTAKPIVKNQYWVVTDGNKKVGNVMAEGTGYEVKLGTQSEFYTTTKDIEKTKKISFEPILKPNKNSYPPFAVFPTKGNKVFNSVLDIRRKLHLYTTSPKSKCYLAAGWFALKQTNEYSTILCPKYIFVQRYDYKGPFMTEEEAMASINTK
jgi:sulfatase maturation enzyme AslB (radical SAM superfamily)